MEGGRPARRGGDRWLSGFVDGIAAALPAVTVFLAVLTIPLSAAPTIAASSDKLSSWIFALYAGPGFLGVLLAFRHRQPLVLTGNIFAIILFASEANRLGFGELAGASIVAGIVVALIGLFRVSERLARLIPAPIVLGLVAGAVLPFVVRTFTDVGQDPWVVGGAVLAYLLARRFLRSVTPLLPALAVGFVAAASVGELGPAPTLALPALSVTAPSLSIQALATVTPVLIVIMLLQANVPSTVFLRTQGYDPPARETDVVSGLGTVGLSFLGPNAVSVPLPIMPLVAGPECGTHERRFRTAVTAGLALVLIGLFGGVALGLVRFLPMSLLQAMAGLALLGVLASSLRQLATSPLILGPLFAFAVIQSGLTVLGLGPYFWALAIGVAVTYLLEHDAVASLAAAPPA